ncbi:MAG TPA: DUF2207 domain-containing protein [Dehalococcoidia bacterium]|nr:DUF2207 domain-containing protein [Dehalococcoidia bacterium]
MRRHVSIGISLLALALALLLWPSGNAAADEGWTIASFDVSYEISEDGIVRVTEDIRVDFGFLQRHGIFREMPVRYEYDDDHDRLISPANVSVDNGDEPWRFELIESDTRLQIKIGDPNAFITGEQRYRIQYLLTGALNALEDHDELFWNVTGDEWPVPIENATATVRVPGGGINRVTCFQGAPGSTAPCESSFTTDLATFEVIGTLGSGSQLTIVTGLEQGAVNVSPPVRVDPVKTEWEQFVDAFDITPWTIGASAAIFLAGLVLAAWQWWIHGRDRWFGEVWYVNDGRNGLGLKKPLFAREGVVVEYEPPPLEKGGRPLRPGEIGVLLDESADTLDVTATIIDLAVRGHIRITEQQSGGFLGLFKKTDYELEKLIEGDEDLLPYEARTKKGIFGSSKPSVMLSSLEKKFYETLEKVKDALYDQMVKKDKLFPRSPSSSRTIYMIAGIVIMVAGVGVGFLVSPLGWSLVGIPIALVGLVVLAMSPSMPSRTAKGRGLYQRALGFRRFMVTAETERQRFAERANIFHEYLPYAIVYKCVDKWSEAFEGLANVGEPDWYVGTRPFVAHSFVSSMSSFSSSISNAIASTPGGSGGSGFSGGGSSGGGGGGGGGGSW